jgi:uncharacterized protein (TIGR03545 family)
MDRVMKWIRWKGLVAFLLVALVIGGIWFLVVDAVIERVIERTGTRIVSARVDLDSADLSLFPLGLTLTRLQITNPDQPMTNAVEIARIAFSMDSLNLLRRKVIVDEMAVDGVRLDTPRTSSGAIIHDSKAAPDQRHPAKGFTLPALEIRDPEDILKSADLQSVKLVESLRTDVQTEKDRWQKQLATLPDKAKLEDYKKRIEGLKSAGKGGMGGLLGGAKEVLAVQEDLKKDLDRLTTAKQDLEKNVARLRKRLEEASRAPQEDARWLMEKYRLSGQGLANLSRMLLGGKIGQWTDQALRWHDRLQPVLNRLAERKKGVEVVKPVREKGMDVRFKEHAPLPDFLTRIARVSITIPAGIITGQVRNITPDQHILGAPLTFTFSGDKLTGLQSLKLDGAVNRVDPVRPVDTATLQVRGYRIENVALSEDSSLSVTLKQATGDLDLRAALRGDAIDAAASAHLQSVQFSGPAKADSAVAAAIASALSDIRSFQLKADLSGTRDALDIQLSSDLDRVLKDVVGKQIQAQTARLEAQLRSAIEAKVSGPLADLKTRVGGLDDISKELTSRLNLGAEATKGSKGGSLGGFKLPF